MVKLVATMAVLSLRIHARRVKGLHWLLSQEINASGHTSSYIQYMVICHYSFFLALHLIYSILFRWQELWDEIEDQ